MWHVIMMTIMGLSAAAETVTLPAGDGAAEEVAALPRQPAVAALVGALMERADRMLVIRHAGGEAGAQRATALRDALVSLGVPSRRMRFEPAAAAPGELILQLITDRQ